MTQRFVRYVVAPVAGLSLVAVPGVAQASGGKGGGKPVEGSGKGDMKGGVIYAETKIRTSGNGTKGTAKTGTLTAGDHNWTPPACWYEPAFSPKEIEAQVKAWRGLDLPFLSGIGDFVGDVLDSRYKDGKPYKDYNLDKQGKGMFWAAVKNPNRPDDPAANACNKQPFWVDEGEDSGEPLAVSPQVLAEYAYDEIEIPSTKVTLAPEGETKVNLPTWAWLDKARFKKLSVTATLPDTNLSATTTATPESLRIEPGTKDAETYPASGVCKIGKDGRIGEPYAKGNAKKTPPCGVKYLRSSGDGSYDLKATITWKVSWTSTTDPGQHPMPDGEFGGEQNVVVKEIQSVNR
ncbi:hypothetical protein [Streptomyces alboflavus]|uniref:hypothetical protein n=1 Tax=Streptomyces alboflavus TaxID=67267 RepID=UPI001878D1AF|nr:hypothetical protein [Streptomyces alboflavus]